jgi:predicted DCC family thiol-disulfide oxidoreductase YuxK
MDKLLMHDKKNLIKLIDIHSDCFNEMVPEISKKTALSVIHALYQNEVIQGIDVNYWAWTLVGKKHWVFLLQVPFTRQVAKLAYRIFARFRHPISTTFNRLFKLKTKQCSNGYCHDKKTPNNRIK